MLFKRTFKKIGQCCTNASSLLALLTPTSLTLLGVTINDYYCCQWLSIKSSTEKGVCTLGLFILKKSSFGYFSSNPGTVHGTTYHPPFLQL